MKADPYDIKTVFGLDRQFFAPLFQRPYIWEQERQWRPLWEDVRKVADELLAGNEDCKPHFLGAVVLDQMKVPTGKPDARSIIDGQQRLTTLQLMLEAVRDLSFGREELALQCSRLEKLLYNQDVSDDEDRFKLWPTNVDRAVYAAIMDTTSPIALRQRIKEACAGKRSRLAEAYEYFHAVIGEWLELDGPEGHERCEALVNTIREKLRIVVIDMDDQDDAQMIFETLNARGTPLLPSDLVKNFLFRKAQEAGEDVDRLHAQYWEPFDVEDGFWRENMQVGRLTRPRIDVFLGHYLSLQKRDDVPLTELFQEYQDFAGRNPDRDVEWHLRTFHTYAQHFKHFLSVDSDSREGVFFDRLGSMQTMTVFPFLLGLYNSTDDESRRIPILENLESFLVRRMICRLTTRGYNRLFLDLVAHLSGDGGYTPEAVRGFLLGQTADSSRWPSDEEFLYSWLETPVYRALTRGRLRMLLLALDSALHDSKSEKYSLKKGLTVEHILPQHWAEHWSLPQESEETAEEYLERRQRRDHLLHTIGNLTLLTESLNPSVSNGAFDRKKKDILRHSAINLNRFLADIDRWDEASIHDRGVRLFEMAKGIWSRPPGGPAFVEPPTPEAGLTGVERKELRAEYWQAFSQLLEATDCPLRPSKISGRTWLPFAIGSSSFRLWTQVSIRNKWIGVGLTCRGESARENLCALLEQKQEIEEELGEELKWEEMPDQQASYIGVYQEADIRGRSSWKTQHEWLAAKVRALDEVFRARVAALSSENGERPDRTLAREIAQNIVTEDGQCQILASRPWSLWFIPRTWADVVPENSTTWKRLARPVSVACWFHFKKDRIRIIFELSAMDDKKLRLHCAEKLNEAGFGLSKWAFDEEAQYSRFYRDSQRISDLSDETEVRTKLQKLWTSTQPYLAKAEKVLREIFETTS